MRKIIVAVVAAACMLLASCSENNIAKAQEAVALVKKHCGIAVSIVDVAAAFAAPNALVTTVIGMANAICAQANRSEFGEDGSSLDTEDTAWIEIIPAAAGGPLQVMPDTEPPLPPVEDEEMPPPPENVPDEETDPEEGMPPPDDCVAVINGVCIHKEKTP